MNETFKKRALITIFLTVFTDLLCFGMIIPLSPILARDLGADGLQVGLLISLYSFAQFLFAPFWGRLSDVFGRKPVILCGLAGVACSHIFFAFSTNLTALFLSRFLAGFFGGNISTAMAYIADVTEKKERSKNMGLIGMAFGLGFTVGPALGGLCVFYGRQLGSVPPFGASFSALGAGIISFINCFLAFLLLRESLYLPKKKTRSYLSPFKKTSTFSRPSLFKIWRGLTAPGLGTAFFMSFVLWLALAQIEPVLVLLVQDDFDWEKTSAYWGFAYIGLLMVLTQGFLVRKCIPRFGEKTVNRWGLVNVALGLLFMGLAAQLENGKGLFGSPESVSFLQGAEGDASPSALILLTVGVTLFSIGYSLASTALSGAVSLLSPLSEQGRIFGVNQSLASLARIAGPITGGWMYRDLSHDSPFIFSGLLTLGIFALALRKGTVFPTAGKATEGIDNGKKGNRIGAIFPRLFRRRRKAGKGGDRRTSLKHQPEEDHALFSVDGAQLNRLLEKRISFKLFYLPSEDKPLSTGGRKERDISLKKKYLLQTATDNTDSTEGRVKPSSGHRPSNNLHTDNTDSTEGGMKPSLLFSTEKKEDPFEKTLLKTAEIKTSREVLLLLKKVPKETPLILVCETGGLSKKFASKVRKKGWKNAYYVEGGRATLKKETAPDPP